MEQGEINKIVSVLYEILHENKTPSFPNFSKDACINAVKKLFEASGIDDFSSYIIKECINRAQNTHLEECLLSNKHALPQSIYGESNKERRRGHKGLNKTVFKNDTINPYAPFYDYDMPAKNYKIVKSLLGHSGRILCVHLMNSKYLITAGDDKLIKIWSLEDGMLIKSLAKHYAPINDLTLSFDSKYLASCDYNGVVIVWNLETWEAIFVLEFICGVELVEFIPMESNFTGTQKTYKFIIVVAKGVVRQIVFDANCIMSEERNDIMSELGDEDSLRAICVSEGGRFVLCGGAWPFLFVFDTQKIIDNVLTLETDGYSIVGVCASVNKPRFCASTSFNFIYEWEYILHGMPLNNIFRKNRNKEGRFKGYWNRRITYLCSDENVHAYRVAYMSNDLIVSICSDNKIRIMDNVIIEIDFLDISVLLPHPTIPVFAICGTFECPATIPGKEWTWGDSKIVEEKCVNFSIDPLSYVKTKKTFINDWIDSPRTNTKPEESQQSVYSFRIYNISGTCILEMHFETRITDGYFSKDGEYICLGDERGKTFILSHKSCQRKYENTPDEQFLNNDFNIIYGNDTTEAADNQCYSASGAINITWIQKEFILEPKNDKLVPLQMSIENNAIKHMHQNFLTYKGFKQKYIVDEKGTKYEQVIGSSDYEANEPSETSDTPQYDTETSSRHNSNTLGYLSENTRRSAREAVDLIKHRVSGLFDEDAHNKLEESEVNNKNLESNDQNINYIDNIQTIKKIKKTHKKKAISSTNSLESSSNDTEEINMKVITDTYKKSTSSTSKTYTFPPRRQNASFHSLSNETSAKNDIEMETNNKMIKRPKKQTKKREIRRKSTTKKRFRRKSAALHSDSTGMESLRTKGPTKQIQRRSAALKLLHRQRDSDSNFSFVNDHCETTNRNGDEKANFGLSSIQTFDESSEEVKTKRFK